MKTIDGAGAVGAGAATRYGSGSNQMMRLLAASAPQHCFKYASYSLPTNLSLSKSWRILQLTVDLSEPSSARDTVTLELYLAHS
jgi:hypothetical protein